ncbi:MAG TPA: protein translocase subunit SecF, partial [Treponema sp.]|nr:protein translocase subunit SecF [Treponema sp.]
MKKIIRFSRFFLPAAILSTVLVIAAVAGYIFMGGFVLGVDFQAGAMQEVQFAPTAFSITYSGRGDAQLGFNRSGLNIVISGAGVESGTFVFPFSE